MERALTNAEMKRADKYTIDKRNISVQMLMSRAGNELALIAEKYAYGRSVTVVCGTGNNGGDGYFAAEKLRIDGYKVKVYAMQGNFSADCLLAKSAYRGEYCDGITGGVVLECLFGTGLSRNLEGDELRAVQAINSSGAFVISADIPAGLNGDNGLKAVAAVKADVTVAIGEYKAGHFLNDGPDFCGKLVKVDIGVICPESTYAHILSDADAGKFFPVRPRNTNKGSYGTARLVAGSEKYTGAAALCVEGALKSGCGYVKLTTDEKVKICLAASYPQVIYSDIDLSADAIAVGCGLGVSEKVYSLIKSLLNNYRGTLIIDADGLNALSAYGKDVLKNSSCEVVLTPHVKEFSRLSGLEVEKIIENPIAEAKKFASEYGVRLLLKNAASILTDGNETIILHRGNTALAKGGSGDLLTGLICGTAARGVDGFNAAAVSSYVLGVTAELCAAEKTEYCVTAQEIAKSLHKAVKRLCNK